MMDFLLPGLKDSWIAGSGLFRLDFQDIGVDRDVKMFNISGLLSGFRISAHFLRRLAINHRRLVAQLLTIQM